MISDDPSMRDRTRKQRALSAKRAWWSDSQKLECVQTWMMTGNVAMTARVLKIPEPTVRLWSNSTWWQEVVEDLKTQDRLTMSNRLKKLVDKSLEVVEDRLERGDFVYDQKSGEMRRKPVAMRDAHKVVMDLDNKREALLREQQPVMSVEAVDDKLNKLAEKFAAMIRRNGDVQGRKAAQEEPVDVPFRELEERNENVEARYVENPDGDSGEIQADDEYESTEDVGGEEQPGVA